MTQRMGTCGQDIPFETQFLIVEARDGSHFDIENEDESAAYVVFLPILEGDFRAVLQGNERNELEICLESGRMRNKTSIQILLKHFGFPYCTHGIISALQEILLLMSLRGVIWFLWQLDQIHLMLSPMQ